MTDDIKITEGIKNIAELHIDYNKKDIFHKKENSQNDIPKDSQKITDLEIINAVERINHAMKIFSKKIRVSLHKQNNTLHAKIIDAKTQALIRDIPIDKVMKLDEKMENMLGISIDKTA